MRWSMVTPDNLYSRNRDRPKHDDGGAAQHRFRHGLYHATDCRNKPMATRINPTNTPMRPGRQLRVS